MPQPTTYKPSDSRPHAVPVFVCDSCDLAVAWPSGSVPLPHLRCDHWLPRSTRRESWSISTVATGEVVA